MLTLIFVFWCLGGKNVLLQIAQTIIAGVLGNYTGKNIFYQGIGRWQNFYRFNFSDQFGRFGAGFKRRPHRAHMAPYHNRHVAAADGTSFRQSNIGRFGHGICFVWLFLTMIYSFLNRVFSSY
jgi:hypothetical protein